jgi:small subunit ribosomal protein S6e
MKLNIPFANTTCQKLTAIDKEPKLHAAQEKPLPQEKPLTPWVKEEWRGYVGPVSAGNNTRCLPMKLDVVTHGRMCLLLSKGHSCYGLKTGERTHKSVRCGCQAESSQIDYWEKR